MNRDALSKCHPAVSFFFFAGAILFSMLNRHPLYLLAGILSGAVYLILLDGRRTYKTVGGTLPLFLLITGVNPLFNTRGNTVLFWLLERPYTLEALLFGAAVAGAFVMVILWFRCYSIVLTEDKFTALFGTAFPALSLLLVMIFRMIPNVARKANQINAARCSVGMGTAENEGVLYKVKHGTVILGALISLSLEESVMTGDSMRARGYGIAKRSSFMRYQMTAQDAVLSIVMALLFVTALIFSLQGFAEAVFLPEIHITKPTGMFWIGFSAYTAYLLLPTMLTIKEDVQWYISRSEI